MKRFFVILGLAFISLNAVAQAPKPKLNGWHLLDRQADGYTGISLNQAYELLKNKKSVTVIVAVIDSGIDTAQEDLKPVLWTNPKEIAGNGKDDDGNGYVDDVHGWNFDGAPDGTNLQRNSHEVERVYHTWKKDFENKKEKDVPADQKFLYQQWLKAAELIEKDYKDARKELPDYAGFYDLLVKTTEVIDAELSVTSFSYAQVVPLLKNRDQKISRSAEFWADIYKRANDTTTKNTTVIEEVKNYKEGLEKKISLKENAPEDWRSGVVKDKYSDINDRYYGNNNLKQGSGDHGTLVAGVIGAVRNNNLGIDGIANNVRIMAVRAVPGGDEHDKDVALAIRYAVDNGASIINMSFGKPVSPYKQFVDDAIRYAESKGVLLVHAAGNDGLDLSTNTFYPNPVYIDGKKAGNVLTVGASGDPSTGGYAAPFSNYSKSWVDIFAPGMNIYSTAGDNRYVGADGTSLAAPVATGVAALLRSYFPSLTPAQIIRIMMASGTEIQDEVTLPGNENKKARFSSLSASGKILNAYGAVKLALEEAQKN